MLVNLEVKGADQRAHEVAEAVFSGGVFLWRPFQIRFAQGPRVGRHGGAPQEGCLRWLRGFAVPRPVETVAAVAAGVGRGRRPKYHPVFLRVWHEIPYPKIPTVPHPGSKSLSAI